MHLLANGVACKIQQLPAGELLAKELRRHLGQLMRLVNDIAPRAWQQLTKPLFLEGQISTQQVMIDHHNIGFLCLLARRVDKAVGELLALVPRTKILVGYDVLPHR